MSNSSTGHINSYYAHTAKLPALVTSLRGKLEKKVVIVGGGLAGLTCGLGLARSGVEAVLLEGNRVGWAASGRNGGFVSDGYSLSLSGVIDQAGRKDAAELIQLSRAGVEYVKNRIAQFGRQDLIQGQGALVLIRHGDGEELQTSLQLHKEFGDEGRRFAPQSELKIYFKSDSYSAGIYNDNAFHIHPLNYALALLEHARHSGVEVYENSPVLNIKREGQNWEVMTSSGTVVAQHVVLASNVGGRIFNPLHRAVLPVATYVGATEPLVNEQIDAIRFEGCISDTRRAGDYYRIIQSDEGPRIIWGGRITTRPTEPRNLKAMLRRDMSTVHPSLNSVQFDRVWMGLMGYTMHKMPLVGELWPERYPGIWACTAMGGHGLNTTAMAGELIADAISDADDRWKLFSAFTPRWAGGPVGQLGVQLSYWHMQLKDRLDEFRA